MTNDDVEPEVTGPVDAPGPDETGGRDPIRLKAGPDGIRTLALHIGEQILPESFVTAGRPVVVQKVSGSLAAQSVDDDAGLPQASAPLVPVLAKRLLAQHCYVWALRSRKDKDGQPTFVKEEVSPTTDTLATALAGTEWPNLPPLRAIIGAPTMRPDGTLLQRPGYDAATGFYLAPRVDLGPIPERPSPAEVATAREFILGSLLGDFPWVDEADRANYLALMATPLLRPFLRCLVPFGVVTATMPGSGKTILTACIGLLVGQRVLTWTHSDEELRKGITSVLCDQGGVVVFDNLQEGAAIDSPVLARLITQPSWSDRGLGGNKVITVPNDRLWLATGNSLSLGGDMASRSVMVRLDPNCPNPEARTGFRIANLDTWVLDPANQREVLRHLLILILDWTANGAPPSNTAPAMRQFSRWAQLLGGFLTHHGVPGFLANISAAHEVDESEAEWAAFLTTWVRVLGAEAYTADAVRKSAIPAAGGWGEVPADPWESHFPQDARGHLISAKSLGRRLTGQVGRWRGHYVLRRDHDSARNCHVYRVEHKNDSA